MPTYRLISLVFAALIIVSVLVATTVDGPWFGIAGWGLALVFAIAWAAWARRTGRIGASTRGRL